MKWLMFFFLFLKVNTKPVRMWKEKSFPPGAGILATKAEKKKSKRHQQH